jgi:phosphatidylserine decarboxylase
MKLSKEGLFFVLPVLILAIIAFILGWLWIGGFFLLFVLPLAFFFRDPMRATPQDENLIFSPADGKIIKIQSLGENELVPYPATQVSIFLSLLDVHITRTPIAGTVRSIAVNQGRYFSAHKDSASEKNAHVSVNIERKGTNVFLKQISGAVARHIKSYIKENDELPAGKKMGIIFLGSRVDIFLPDTFEVKVFQNQKVKAGETALAERKA